MMADKKAVADSAVSTNDKGVKKADGAKKKTSLLTKVKNFFGRIAKYFKDTKSELKKVVWPSKKDVKTNTITVLVVVAVAAVFMVLLDLAFGGIIHLMIGV